VDNHCQARKTKNYKKSYTTLKSDTALIILCSCSGIK